MMKMKTSSVGLNGTHSCSFPETFDCSGASRNGRVEGSESGSLEKHSKKSPPPQPKNKKK